MLNNATLEQILHELIGVIADLGLLLHLFELKFQLIKPGVLGPLDVLLVELAQLGFLDLALGSPFLRIYLQEVRTHSSRLCKNNRGQADN